MQHYGVRVFEKGDPEIAKIDTSEEGSDEQDESVSPQSNSVGC